MTHPRGSRLLHPELLARSTAACDQIGASVLAVFIVIIAIGGGADTPEPGGNIVDEGP